MRVLVDGCVIAPSGTAQATLAAVDNPRNLVWRGRSNLYSRVRAFLEPILKLEGAQAIVDFNRWKETATEVREVDTTVVSKPVWKSAHPLQELVIEQEDPSLAFRLDDEFAHLSRFGARQGPHGSRLLDAVSVAAREETTPARGTRPPVDAGNPSSSAPPGRSLQAARDTPALPSTGQVAAAGAVGKPDALTHDSGEDSTGSLPAMPPMTNSPEPEVERPAPADHPKTDAVDSAASPSATVRRCRKARGRDTRRSRFERSEHDEGKGDPHRGDSS